MIKSIWLIILKQNTKVKILLSIVLLLSIAGAYKSVQYALVKRKLVIEYKKQIKSLKSEILDSEDRQKKTVNKSKKKTKKVQQKQKDIDKKLKQDEKTIDNDSISDDDIKRYITDNQ